MSTLKVKLKSTGQTGTIDSSEFDPSLFEPQVGGLAGVAEKLPGYMGAAGLLPTPFAPMMGIAGQGAGYIARDIARPMYGVPSANFPQAISGLTEEATKGFGKGMAGLTGYGVLQTLPYLLGATTVVGKKLMEHYGNKIAEMTKYSTGEYPYKTLQQEIGEKTTKYQKESALSNILKSQLETVKGTAGTRGQVPLKDLQEFKELAQGNINWGQGQNKNVNEMWKTLQNIYKNATTQVEPGLEGPLSTYSKLAAGQGAQKKLAIAGGIAATYALARGLINKLMSVGK